MWPFDPPPPADEPDAWYEDVGDAIYDVATAPENAIYFGLALLAVTLTITIVCVFRGWSRSHPPPETPPASPKKPVLSPPGTSHVVHKKSVQHAKAVEVGDPEELLEECEEHVETHLSLEAAKKAAEKDLPRDGDERLWRLSAPRRQFARLGLGVFAYFSYLEAITYVFLALLLISTSNIVSNVSGGYYNRDELGLQSWLFAVTSIGNAVALSPAYGASEFVCAMLMVVFLYKGKAALEEEVESAEAAEVTAADFAVMLDGVPGARCVKPEDHASFVRGIERALNDFVGADESHSSLEPDVANRPLRVKCIVPALDQREIILLAAEHSAHNANLDAIEADIKVHPTANKPEQTRSISRRFTALPAPKRERGNAVFKHLGETTRSLLEKEEEERKKDDSCEEKLAAHVRKGTWDRCAGVVFVSFADQHDADRVLKRASEIRMGNSKAGRGRLVRSVSFDLPTPRGVGGQRWTHVDATVPNVPDGRKPMYLKLDHYHNSAYVAVSRPPEPSDILWHNLACSGEERRWAQFIITTKMLLISLTSCFVIAVTTYFQPELLASLDEFGPFFRTSSSNGVILIGTVLIIGGYLSVFLTVPGLEERDARHRTVSAMEVSMCLKFVFFQYLATRATVSIFLLNTEWSANRYWYTTGGCILVNGMLVDLFMIQCVVQGWNVGAFINRNWKAPRAVTQHEMNELYKVPAGIYVVDRLQMVTKFVVVALTYSSAMPILYGVVVAVAFTAKFLDRYNVLRVLIDMRKTDESVVRAIFRFVLPIAIVMHCYTASTLFDDLHTGTDIMTNYTVYEAFNPFMKVVHDLQNAGEAAQTLLSAGNISAAAAALEIYEGEANVIVRWSFYINGGLALLFFVREFGRAWFKDTDSHNELERIDPLKLLEGPFEERLANLQENILNAKMPGFKVGTVEFKGFQVGVGAGLDTSSARRYSTCRPTTKLDRVAARHDQSAALAAERTYDVKGKDKRIFGYEVGAKYGRPKTEEVIKDIEAKLREGRFKDVGLPPDARSRRRGHGVMV